MSGAGRSRARRGLVALILTACPAVAPAFWTGVEVSLGNTEADWEFDAETRAAETSLISFQAEEKTAAGLRVGVSLGYESIRLVADSPAPTLKFDARFVGIYLNRLLSLGEHFEFYAQLDLSYHSGRDSLGDERIEIDWSEIAVEVGASLRAAHYRFTPYLRYSDIDGDVGNVDGIDVFELDEPVSRGLHIDYFVEPTAYIRLSLQGGGDAGGYLHFVRRY